MKSFIHGFGLALDFGATGTYDDVLSLDADDASALASDWQAVGDAFREVFEGLK